MKPSIYLNYVSRSLRRGGQRTVLAFFCVAVGVMSIVALQLVSLMINGALTSDMRDANGGDIQVSARLDPFKQSDLSFFLHLKNDGTITNLLGHFVFKTDFSVNGPTIIALILASALLSAIAALLVAWKMARMRPLAVLRYE